MKQQNTTPATPSNAMADNLFEQMANISKAHAYDVLAEQVTKLKETMKLLIDLGELEDIKFTEPADTEAFQKLVKHAKILSL